MRRSHSTGLPARLGAALKPASFPKLLVPMAIGQAAGWLDAGRPALAGFVAGSTFTVLDGAFIVLLNDWADQRVDGIKRREFPHSGSPKTIPDGLLPAGLVLALGAVAGVLAMAIAVVGQGVLGRPWLVTAAAVALGTFAAYSLPPLSLNYRGGGEVLEALGVGAVLPWLNAYAQGGLPRSAVLPLLPGLVALSLASAVASGLSDEESDRLGGKRTVVTAFGNARGRAVVTLASRSGAAAWALVAVAALARLVPPVVGLAGAAGALVVLARLRGLAEQGALAVTGAFAAQREYKALLHGAIWSGTLSATATLCLGALAGATR